MNNTWLSLLPALITIASAIWTKKILPSLILGLLVGAYLLNPTLIGGFETAIDSMVKILTDKGNLQVLLFLYLFSGFIALIHKAGGTQAFADYVSRYIHSERGVFYTLWALIPVTFIDCGFRVMGAGSMIRPLADKNKIAKERIAFTLNNTASPVTELIPIATTFVGFNIANIGAGLKAAGIDEKHSAYDVLLHAIPYEFFSIFVLLITFATIFYQWRKPNSANTNSKAKKTSDTAMSMDMDMDTGADKDELDIQPRIINLLVPMIAVVTLSLFFFSYFKEDPNKAMLVALFITLVITTALYFFQKYRVSEMTKDILSGGNDIMKTIAILVVAWALGIVSQELHLSQFVQEQVGTSLPAWGTPVALFLLSSAVTYFTGSGWAAASLIMPFAITLALTSGSGIPICVGAVITGGTFGDVTSPVAGMTNMSSHVAGVDQMKYLNYASPYNFTALALAAIAFLAFGFVG